MVRSEIAGTNSKEGQVVLTRFWPQCDVAKSLLVDLEDLTFGSAETRLPTPPAAEVPEPEEPGVVDKQRAERVARNRVIDRKVWLASTVRARRNLVTSN
eukprot:110689-Amphidinium_carterae.1